VAVSTPEKFITLGHPSYVWRRGQERRLDLIRKHVDLEGKRVLDVGCGIGTYVKRFQIFTPDAFGVDIDPEKVAIAQRTLPNISWAPAEELPFEDNSFDVIMLHEVIEHVDDDRRTIGEAVRCLRPGGKLIIFAPNRMYPFETHGFYFRERFVFRLLPLINYTPDFFRNLFCHHVRIYTRRGIERLFTGLDVDFVVRSHIYPGFDNIAERKPLLGQFLQLATHMAERTPLRAFGISHFIVAQKR
jgi:ubiquinone/menaquinone biosynthesis C-methylase UbiE